MISLFGICVALVLGFGLGLAVQHAHMKRSFIKTLRANAATLRRDFDDLAAHDTADCLDQFARQYEESSK